MILTFDLLVLNSPNEPVHFLGFFYLLDPDLDQHLSMRIRIREAFLLTWDILDSVAPSPHQAALWRRFCSKTIWNMALES